MRAAKYCKRRWVREERAPGRSSLGVQWRMVPREPRFAGLNDKSEENLEQILRTEKKSGGIRGGGTHKRKGRIDSRGEGGKKSFQD